jgi:hypothetical protein
VTSGLSIYLIICSPHRYIQSQAGIALVRSRNDRQLGWRVMLRDVKQKRKAFRLTSSQNPIVRHACYFGGIAFAVD